MEGILGFKFKGKEGFTVEPCIPDDWHNYDIYYNREECKYSIQVKRGEEKGIWLDGRKVENNIVPFLKEGKHEVNVVI